MSQTTTPSFALELRESTASLHTVAERSGLQQLLVSGRVSRPHYAQHLGQMLLVHRALDAALRQAASVTPQVAAIVRDEQYQEPYLLQDLAFLGVDPAAIEPLPATAKIVAEIRQMASEDPAALLGYHYVLEGANNGNRFIARAMAGPLGVRPGAAGTRYLDPYGEKQRELWAAFKTNLDAITLTETSRARAIAGAKSMFEAVAKIGDEIMAAGENSAIFMGSGPAVTVQRN